jgi:glycosyltransferase involved in cell wall biosynthesis
VKISAVLACRNEEPFIQAWLEETAAYAHEILIAVHAPTDATADIIARFKADSPVPIRCEWFPARTVARFGYSVMKNEMIALATGDWITSIDADEEIGLSPEDLGRALDAATAAGWSVLSLLWATHRSTSEVPPGWTMDRRAELRRAHRPSDCPNRRYKIFRNRVGFWWRGIIHEQLMRHDCHAPMFSHDTGAFLHHYCYLRRSAEEWKQPLYSSLICRARDCPHLRPGTHPDWYEGGFWGDGARVRAEAAHFEHRRLEWFPETPRRCL